MRVCMVAAHGCLRVFKEARALMLRGHVVDLLAEEQTLGVNLYETFTVHADRNMLVRAVANSPADIFHVHNEPDWLVAAVREGAGERPVIFDVHDLQSLVKCAPPDEDELAAFDAADGFVHVSPTCADQAARVHGRGKPVAVLPCLINEEFYPAEGAWSEPSWSTICYEGGLGNALPAGSDPRLCNVRALEPVVKAFVDQGFEFRLHPGSGVPHDAGVYERLGAVVSQPLLYPVLLRAIRSYGYGFVGSTYSAPLMEAALPNKLFEYLSQGVVPVVWRAGTAAAFVREHGVGIVLESLDNLREQLAPGPEIRKRVLAKRRSFAMERHIGVVEDLYAQVLDARAAAAA